MTDDLPHGLSRYVRGCRCEVCSEAKAKYTKRQKLLASKGVTGYVAANVARRVIEQQMAQHTLSFGEFVKASQVNERTIRAVLNGSATRVQKKCFVRLQRLPGLAPEVRNYVPALASGIRMECAAAIGYGTIPLREWDSSLMGHSTMMRPGRMMKIPTVERYIAWLRHAMENPLDNYTADTAARKGWRKPEAYDQELLFDPYWNGQDGLLDTPMTTDERFEEFVRIYQTGTALEEAMARVGWHNKKQMDHARRKYVKQHGYDPTEVTRRANAS